MYEKYQRDYDWPVRLRTGAIITYVEELEALDAQEAIDKGRFPKPPQAKRLVPFGQGITVEDGVYTVTFMDEWIGKFPSLKSALKAWDEAEQYARYQQAVDTELADIDARFYDGVEYDKDGYKIRKPRATQDISG
jgi:hypothetical protein